MNNPRPSPATEPAEAVDFLQRIDDSTLVVLDFDETLFLRNSTEEYLNSLRPRALGAIWLLILEILQPWKRLPGRNQGRETKDWVRVVSATLLFPWTWFLWRLKARRLAVEFENRQLAAAVAGHPGDRTIVATHGFSFIVKPLVRHMSIAAARVVGCRFLRGLPDRQKGKDEILGPVVSGEEMAGSAVVTDSPDDMSLLEIVAHPFLVQWPQARYVPALSDAYFPFFYLEFVKRPGQSYTRWVILETHLVILLLAYSWISSMPLVHVFGMAALLVSFWTIYEIGYYENDRVAEGYEKAPALSPTYHQLSGRMRVCQPWFFAAAAGACGVLLIQLADLLSWDPSGSLARISERFSFARGLTDLALWMPALVGVRLLFAAYNYADEATRVWVFPLLQAAKYLVFMVVATTNLVGMTLLLAQVFVDWVPYLVYRCEGRRELVQEQIIRLFVFLLIIGGVMLSRGDWSPLRTWQFGAVLLWVMIRGKCQLSILLANMHRVGRER